MCSYLQCVAPQAYNLGWSAEKAHSTHTRHGHIYKASRRPKRQRTMLAVPASKTGWSGEPMGQKDNRHRLVADQDWALISTGRNDIQLTLRDRALIPLNRWIWADGVGGARRWPAPARAKTRVVTVPVDYVPLSRPGARLHYGSTLLLNAARSLPEVLVTDDGEKVAPGGLSHSQLRLIWTPTPKHRYISQHWPRTAGLWSPGLESDDLSERRSARNGAWLLNPLHVFRSIRMAVRRDTVAELPGFSTESRPKVEAANYSDKPINRNKSTQWF